MTSRLVLAMVALLTAVAATAYAKRERHAPAQGGFVEHVGNTQPQKVQPQQPRPQDDEEETETDDGMDDEHDHSSDDK